MWHAAGSLIRRSMEQRDALHLHELMRGYRTGDEQFIMGEWGMLVLLDVAVRRPRCARCDISARLLVSCS